VRFTYKKKTFLLIIELRNKFRSFFLLFFFKSGCHKGDKKQNPFIDKISLKLLLDYYDTYLAPYEYTYELIDGETERTIQLRLDPHRLCHLLGVETVTKAKYSRSFRKRAEYKDHEGYE
jgi:hypothetical protein